MTALDTNILICACDKADPKWRSSGCGGESALRASVPIEPLVSQRVGFATPSGASRIGPWSVAKVYLKAADEIRPFSDALPALRFSPPVRPASCARTETIRADSDEALVSSR